MQIKKTLILLTTGILSLSALQAAITPMSSAAFTTTIDNQYGFDSFDVASMTYSISSIGTVISGGGSSVYWNGGSGNTTGIPSGNSTSIADGFITTGYFGTNTVTINIGTTLNTGDSQLIYIVEMGGNDDNIVINPLVGGSVDATWSLTLNSSDGDWGQLTNTGIFDWDGNPSNQQYGTTFTIADFTGGTGSLTNVTGIQIVGDGRIDIAEIGVAAIPEPSVTALILGLGGLGLVIYRKRLQ